MSSELSFLTVKLLPLAPAENANGFKLALAVPWLTSGARGALADGLAIGCRYAESTSGEAGGACWGSA
eukprot:COSAG06_NODE_47679_length_337_cov_1.247899_1_plen_67_part_01